MCLKNTEQFQLCNTVIIINNTVIIINSVSVSITCNMSHDKENNQLSKINFRSALSLGHFQEKNQLSKITSALSLGHYGVLEMFSADVASKGQFFITAADFVLSWILRTQRQILNNNKVGPSLFTHDMDTAILEGIKL